MELKIEARNVELRKSWQTKISEEQEKLIRHYPNFVLHLRVSIEATNYKEGGYEIKLVASVPNDMVVVTRNAETVRAALTESFDVLSLQLKEIQRKKRKSKKQPGEESTDKVGVIRKISPHESYGFIMSSDKRDIYFHENALKNLKIETLSEGDSVVFGETYGDKGPQASWVKAAG